MTFVARGAGSPTIVGDRHPDVADHAGVSVKTVSNVVHGHPSVSRPMRSNVQASIEALGYVPNISARSLRTGRSGLVGLAVPRVSDPYFSEVAAAVMDAAARRGISVLVEQTGGEFARENDVLLGRRPTIVDGLIFSPISVTQAALDEASPVVPLVLLGEHLMASQRCRVAVDNVVASAAGIRAVFELIESGTPFDAPFCFNDLLALGAVEALQQHGRAVPGDVAVVGFDDIDEGRHTSPDLTTVAVDLAVLAEAAVDSLVRRLDDPSTPDGDSFVVPHRLVVRGSTVATPAADDDPGAAPR